MTLDMLASDEKAVADTTLHVVHFMQRIVEHIRPSFPQTATAVADLIVGRKMTNWRWNELAATLASLAGVPGAYLLDEEHDVRNPALAAVIVAQKMASATFGGRVDVGYELWCATWMSDELTEWLDRIKDGKEKQEKPAG